MVTAPTPLGNGAAEAAQAADGTQASENAFDARVGLFGRTYGFSLFAADTLALGSHLGSGRAPGVAVVGCDGEWRPAPWLKLPARLANPFDTHCYTAVQLSLTGFAAAGAFVGRPFVGPVTGGDRPLVSPTCYSPGAPRTIWPGARVAFGGR